MNVYESILQKLTQEEEIKIIEKAYSFLEKDDIEFLEFKSQEYNYGFNYGLNRYKSPFYLQEKRLNYDVLEINDIFKPFELLIVFFKDNGRKCCIVENTKLITLFNETYNTLKKRQGKHTNKQLCEKEDLSNQFFQSMEQNYSDNDEHSDGSIEKAYEQAENVIKEITLDYTIKHDKDKPKLSQVPKEALEAIAEVMAYGTDKYGYGTWNRVEVQRYIDALARHLYAMQDIDENGREYINLAKKDDESGIEHLYHLLCNAAYAAALYKRSYRRVD